MTQFPAFGGQWDQPGISPALETFENAFIDYNSRNPDELPVWLSGASRDSQNTVTSMLRQGLAIGGPIDAGETGAYKVKEWSPTATDGSAFLLGFLKHSVKVVDASGTNADKYTQLVIGGALHSDRIIIPGNAATGVSGNYASLLLAQLGHRFILDKHPRSLQVPFDLPPMALSTQGAGTSPHTFTADDAGKLWTNDGDAGLSVTTRTVNLPDPIIGLRYRFHQVDAVAPIIVATTGAGVKIIGNGNPVADQVTVDTASGGAFIELIGYSTTQYLVVASQGTLVYA